MIALARSYVEKAVGKQCFQSDPCEFHRYQTEKHHKKFQYSANIPHQQKQVICVPVLLDFGLVQLKMKGEELILVRVTYPRRYFIMLHPHSHIIVHLFLPQIH
jgi:hypothetical protein